MQFGPHSNDVRLEVGTAHQRNVAETSHVDNHRFITYVQCFTRVAPVGGAHL
jgi:hypothetical protein